LKVRATVRSDRRDVGLWRCAVSLAAFAVLAGCATAKEDVETVFRRESGVFAQLKGTGSTANGMVRIVNYRGGIAVQAFLVNTLPGTYRIALHERGNCSSPNLFSAGPAWAPPGANKAPGDLLPSFTVDSNGDLTSYVVFVSGVSVDGPPPLRGHSVVIHHGYTISDALPGLPNNRMACGVLEDVGTSR